MWSSEPSIERRLSRSLLLGAAALVVLLLAGLDLVVGRRLEREFERGLEAKALALVTLTKQSGRRVELDFADEFMPEFEAATDPDYFELWLGDAVLERSRSLRGRDLPRDAEVTARPRFRDLTLPDGRPGRLVEVDFVPQQDGPGVDGDERALDPRRAAATGRPQATVAVATGRERLDAAMRFVEVALGGAGLLFLGACSFLVGRVVRSGLRPLTDVADQVGELDVRHLHRRIETRGLPRELAPLAAAFNATLERLEASFERERRFSSDVAHELRTPVAELRNLCEVGVRWPGDAAAQAAFFADARDVAEEMSLVIGNLLALARCDAGIETVACEEVALGRFVAAVWDRQARHAAERGVRLEARVPAGATIVTDRAKLEIVLGNLLDNAVSHGAPGVVDVAATVADGDFRLVVRNPAPGLVVDDLPTLFDRFWRKDAARAGGHAGLGLSLARRLGELLGYEVRAALEPAGILAVEVAGPRQVASPPPTAAVFSGSSG